jgi:hypothetical protein
VNVLGPGNFLCIRPKAAVAIRGAITCRLAHGAVLHALFSARKHLESFLFLPIYSYRADLIPKAILCEREAFQFCQ